MQYDIKSDSPLYGLFQRMTLPHSLCQTCALSINVQEYPENLGGKIMDALQLISKDSMKENVPEIFVGDTVKVHVNIKEGDKSRIQVFEGTVIAKKHGGISETFTVRRVAHGCGIERVFPIHSPAVNKVEIVRKGKVRRAKLYYLRDRVGKAAKVKEQVK